MKLSINDCLGIFKTIEFFKEAGLNFELAWRLDDVQQELKKHVERFQTEQNKLADKYGTKDGEGFKIEPENIPIFNNEINKILSVEVEVKIKKIAFDELKELKLNGTTNINAFKKVVERAN